MHCAENSARLHMLVQLNNYITYNQLIEISYIFRPRIWYVLTRREISESWVDQKPDIHAISRSLNYFKVRFSRRYMYSKPPTPPHHLPTQTPYDEHQWYIYIYILIRKYCDKPNSYYVVTAVNMQTRSWRKSNSEILILKLLKHLF